jgi:hypothetical protein
MLHGREKRIRKGLRSDLDDYFEAYARGEFPTDEELTEWKLDD